MLYRYCCALFLLGMSDLGFAQSYTSYFIGDTADLQRQGQGGICLMGGATEQDDAARWFLSRANGGDVVVLRSSGSDGYNTYFYQQLGVPIHSVETFVCHSRAASSDPYLLRRLAEAEAVWFAGGDQWTYLQYWRGTAIDSLLNQGIAQRGLVVGGTSAGMAIQGQAYFSAERGTVRSNTALLNPYDSTLTLDTAAFLKHRDLQQVITDTHYDNPDRKGRHMTFLARLVQDYGLAAKGIGCDEYTAVCIDTSGLARVFGDAPTYDDNAYFLQAFCPSPTASPATCQPDTALTWLASGNGAVLVYHAQGTPNGTATFDLRDANPNTGRFSGGSWEYWNVQDGSWSNISVTHPDCLLLEVAEAKTATADWVLYPNPCPLNRVLVLESAVPLERLQVINAWGQVVLTHQNGHRVGSGLDLSHLHQGYYWVQVLTEQGWSQQPLILQE